jgi:hypothetical protein
MSKDKFTVSINCWSGVSTRESDTLGEALAMSLLAAVNGAHWLYWETLAEAMISCIAAELGPINREGDNNPYPEPWGMREAAWEFIEKVREWRNR